MSLGAALACAKCCAAGRSLALCGAEALRCLAADLEAGQLFLTKESGPGAAPADAMAVVLAGLAGAAAEALPRAGAQHPRSRSRARGPNSDCELAGQRACGVLRCSADRSDTVHASLCLGAAWRAMLVKRRCPCGAPVRVPHPGHLPSSVRSGACLRSPGECTRSASRTQSHMQSHQPDRCAAPAGPGCAGMLAEVQTEADRAVSALLAAREGALPAPRWLAACAAAQVALASAQRAAAARGDTG